MTAIPRFAKKEGGDFEQRREYVWEEIEKNPIYKAWKAVEGLVTGLYQYYIGIPHEGKIENAKEWTNKHVIDPINGLIANTETKINKLIADVKESWNEISDKVKNYWTNTVKPSLETAKTAIVDGLKGIKDAVSGKIASGINAVMGAVRKGINKIQDVIREKVIKPIDAVRQRFESGRELSEALNVVMSNSKARAEFISMAKKYQQPGGTPVPTI